MPDLKRCQFSPFLRDPEVIGAAMLTGHARYCDLINPRHKDYSREMAAFYVELSYLLNGKEAPATRPIPEKPRNWPEGLPEGRVTIPPHPGGGGRKDGTSDLVELLSDPDDHMMVYEAARDCPFKVVSMTCCRPDRCGPGGVHQGNPVTMAVCYPCSIGRLGVESATKEGDRR